MQTKEKANQTEGMFSRQAEQAWQVTAQPAMSRQQGPPQPRPRRDNETPTGAISARGQGRKAGLFPKNYERSCPVTPAILLWFQELTMI